jgi:hypothetical protein
MGWWLWLMGMCLEPLKSYESSNGVAFEWFKW